MMDIRQLRYFVQIVECGSLSKASRQLLVAQPALSQQLAKLEGLVGKPLLHRSPKGVWPTDNGLALYHHASFMLRQLDQALSIARSDVGAIHGMVSVGLAATTVSAIGLSLVRRIRERNFLYSLPPERLTGVAAVVASELKETARELVEGGSWHGFEQIAGLQGAIGR